MSHRHHFFEFDLESLRAWFGGEGLPPYRANQLLEWVYQKGVIDPRQMTNFSKAEREKLAGEWVFTAGQLVQHQTASDGVRKLLVQWSGGAQSGLPMLHDKKLEAECVLIPSLPKAGAVATTLRRTACVSSQAGCPVGCTFCASGANGLEGNLTKGQIVEQVWRLGHLQTPYDQNRVTHVVFMGMGEPLANFANVTEAIATLTAPWGMGLSARRITISTVGLPAQIRRLAKLRLAVNLALSIHAPNDQLRRRLIPWAQYVTLEQLVDAGRYYFQRTGREVTLEYTLLDGVNDQPHHARELASLAKKLRGNVNLIRYNEVKGMPFSRPSTQAVLGFQAILQRAGVNTHIRASRGRDIAAACGQLRHQHATDETRQATPCSN